VRELVVNLKKSKENFVEATLSHDEVVLERFRLEAKVNDLKDYTLKTHSQSFIPAIRQAILLYGILEENELDENKVVYNGQLLWIDDIPFGVAHEDTTVLDDTSSGEERTP